MNITTKTTEETIAQGSKLAATLKGGDIVCLRGELGAGKTTYVKGLAAGLGISNTMTSPTFTLMNVYPVVDHPTIKKLVHIDTYRLNDEQELLAIGVEDYLGVPGVLTLIEWPEKLLTLLKNKHSISITLEHGNGTERNITLN